MFQVRVTHLAPLVAGAMILSAATPFHHAKAESASPFWSFPWETSAGNSSSSGGSGEGFFGGVFGSGTSGGQSGRQVVPFSTSHAPGQIIVSFADRRLYYVQARGQAISYPIATPRPRSRWQGTLRISRKAVNPTWTPTAEMRQENPTLPAVVPGGHPRNPLGYRALYLGSSLYRIHGTDAPWTIGQPVSRGCIRMHNSDVADLYRRAGVGTKVVVTYNRYASASLY